MHKYECVPFGMKKNIYINREAEKEEKINKKEKSVTDKYKFVC